MMVERSLRLWLLHIQSPKIAVRKDILSGGGKQPLNSLSRVVPKADFFTDVKGHWKKTKISIVALSTLSQCIWWAGFWVQERGKSTNTFWNPSKSNLIRFYSQTSRNKTSQVYTVRLRVSFISVITGKDISKGGALLQSRMKRKFRWAWASRADWHCHRADYITFWNIYGNDDDDYDFIIHPYDGS